MVEFVVQVPAGAMAATGAADAGAAAMRWVRGQLGVRGLSPLVLISLPSARMG